LLLAAGAAVAKPPPEQTDNLLNDRVTLQAGLETSSNQTLLRRDSTTGAPGTVLDAEKDLGLPSRKLVGRAELTFRMKDRHRMHVGNYYVPLDRRATTLLQKTINFGDTTYNVNENVASELKMRLFALSYSYSIVKNDRVELGAGLGFDIIGLEAAATVAARLRTERVDRSAPAPLAGVEGTVRLSSRFYAEARGQYVKVNVHNFEGTLDTFEGNVLYRLSPNITFGLGYSAFKVDVNSLKTTDGGRLDLRSTGPQLFARVGF
jgi:hypothetical protein